MAQYFWVGNGGNWDDTTHWSSSSGGSSGVGPPTSADTATFDANSFSSGSQTVTVRSGHTNACSTLDMSAVINSPTLALGASSTLATGGNVTIPSGVTVTRGASAAWQLSGSGTMTWTIGADLSNVQLTPTGTGTLTLGSDLTVGSIFNTGTAYTFTLNNHNLNICFWEENGSTINCGSGTIQLVVGTGAFTASLTLGNSSTATWNANTSLISVQAVGSNTFNIFQSVTFNNIEFTAASSGAKFNTSSALTMNSLTIDPGTTTKFTSSQTYTINGTLSMVGTSGSPIVIQTISGSSPAFTLNAVNNNVQAYHVTVTNCTASGKINFIDTNGTDGGGNTHWTFNSGTDPTFATAAAAVLLML